MAYTDVIQQIWTEIHSIAQKPQSDASSLLQTPPPVVSMALILTYSKGRKLTARLVRCLPLEQRRLLAKSVFMTLKHIMPTATDPLAVLKELEEYANLVIFPLVQVIADVDAVFLVECLSGALKANEIIQIARTKACHSNSFTISYMAFSPGCYF